MHLMRTSALWQTRKTSIFSRGEVFRPDICRGGYYPPGKYKSTNVIRQIEPTAMYYAWLRADGIRPYGAWVMRADIRPCGGLWVMRADGIRPCGATCFRGRMVSAPNVHRVFAGGWYPPLRCADHTGGWYPPLRCAGHAGGWYLPLRCNVFSRADGIRPYCVRVMRTGDILTYVP